MSDLYHKIQTVWKHDPETNFKTVIESKWAKPEFGFLADCEWEWTEKVDGMNVRVLWDGNAVSFGGRSDNAQMPTVLMAALVAMFPTVLLNECFDDGTPVVLFGEGYGGKIRKGSKYRMDQSFVLFDVTVGGLFLERENVADVARKLAIDAVPVVGHGSLHKMISDVRDRPFSLWGEFEAEGLVARPIVELTNRWDERVITKLKAKDFPS